ncbi:MAG: AAA family ATPase [Clostridia bacterium]|nr:AAA family ATPase [Clostridia bacterium]
MNQVIALVGMCGSGKSVCCEEFRARGWEYVYFGGVTMKELEKRGLERNEVNERAVREELRRNLGPAAFAILLKEEIREKAEKKPVCLDGLYSWSELKVLREEFGDRLTVVAIITERKKRYERISQRVIRPLTPKEAESRDIAEIENMEKGGPIAMADLFLMNLGDVESFRADTVKLIERAEVGEL